MENCRIRAVVVTFNRLEKLKKALNALTQQTTLPAYILVVNNASTDGTTEYLYQWRQENGNPDIKKLVLNEASNRGSSGGFHDGLAEALKLNAEWIYVSDDDAYPASDVFERIKDYIDQYQGNVLAAVCTSVIQYGKIATAHRRIIGCNFWKIIERDVPEEEYQNDYFECKGYSYVGTVLNKSKLAMAGLPVAEYFIQWDDTEHSIRMSRQGKIICIPRAEVKHEFEYSKSAGFQWKDYYRIRNRMDGIRRNYPRRYFFIKSG